MHSFLFLILLVSTTQSINCLPHLASTFIFSGAGAVIFTSIINWPVHFPWQGRCEKSWVNFNATAFYSHLQEHLFGQHLVTWSVSQSLKAHISKEHPKKALVMSFHGWTGSGKNYASKLIADALYEGGSQSDFVHWYIAPRDFPHASDIEKYKNKLLQEIPEHTRRCKQSMFVFDEIDKMSPGIIDAIKSFIDFYDDVDGLNYKKNIFIFLSNSGGSEIARVALNFWLDGKDREDMDMRDVEPLINQGAFNEKGGLHFSEIVKRNLIDVYVPFLPLEKSHVRKCIVQELKAQELDVNKSIIDRVAEQIIYYPPEFELFSISGCKKISHKVDLYAEV